MSRPGHPTVATGLPACEALLVVQVGSYPTRSDAELAQSALAAAGISSEVVSDDAGGAYPFDLTGGARLLVDEADAEDAAAVLSEPTDADREEKP